MAATVLSTSGFRRADSVVLPRLIVSVSGTEKSGKTHFMLTAPDPIALFNLDTGLEGVVHKFAGKEIYVKDIAYTPETAAAAWDDFAAAYKSALQSPDIRTVAVDTGTEAWELIRLAKFGRTAQIMPYMYGPVNKDFRNLVRDAFQCNKNVIWLHKLRPVYIDDKRTARVEPAGFSDMPYLVQANMRVDRDWEDETGDFELIINDCRQNPDMANFNAVGPLVDFVTLAMMILPGTTERDWYGR